MGEEEEPLAEWAARRDERVGRLRVVPLYEGRRARGAHVRPGEPRVVERWSGCAWEAFAVTRDLAEALRLVRPGEEPPGPAERCSGSWVREP
ncbi:MULTISPECIES: DUF6087 family protein [Streptomyces]|uniref:DUF6087 family protein n=1 Tax=Streptomyces evansiae TaxID=3075535 RepID=A0ABU2R8W4_9ACTN|nr:MULTISPECIES: DUF6087 family protein [unclassified Streptomyces]MDT0413136.1 DUF6087 family protein [Streptomyces sp. DSM 41979]MYQ61213.1 hypothetical protein [Streptomyces sp. SID4926]SCE44174.1 hypothetical protein GA0115252_149512 [Streptomyces sp. DfronAA-171]